MSADEQSGGTVIPLKKNGIPGTEDGAASADADQQRYIDVESAHINAVAGQLHTRLLDRESADEEVFFPWPGTEATLPGANETWPAEALNQDELRPKWDPLWKRVGPLWPDRLVVLVGATGSGKSAFAVQVAESIARSGKPVLYASAEMGADAVVARMLAIHARGRDTQPTSANDILRGRFTAARVKKELDALTKACPNLYVWAPRAKHRSGKKLQQMAEAVSAQAGGQPPFVVVDYVQRFADSEDDKRYAVSGLSGELRDLSRPGGLGDGWPGAAVLALSSVARTHYGTLLSTDSLDKARKGTPLVGLGKESGELEYDAPLVMVMATDRDEEDNPMFSRRGMLVIAKNREGGTGAFELAFWPAAGRFDVKGLWRAPANQGQPSRNSQNAPKGLASMLEP